MGALGRFPFVQLNIGMTTGTLIFKNLEKLNLIIREVMSIENCMASIYQR